MDWFLYDNGHRHGRVKAQITFTGKKLSSCFNIKGETKLEQNMM